MNAFINYLVEANLGLCLFLLLYWALLTKETDFVVKRMFLLMAIGVSLLFPLFHFTATTQFVPALVPTKWLPEVVVYGETLIPKETEVNFNTWQIMRLVYSGGVIITLVAFIWQLIMVIRMIRRVPSYTRDRLTILESSDDLSSFSFFRFIFIGKSHLLSDAEKQLIIDHERIHAKHLHSIDVMLTNVMGILFWFNPVIRIYKKIFVHLHEYEADARAVKYHNVNDYCSLLAKVALLSADFKIANHFSNSLTIKRIEMMRTFKSKIRWWKIAALAAAIPLYFFVVACQDQVANDMTNIARNANVAVMAPESVVSRFEEVKKANPNSTYLLVEFNAEGDKLLEKMEAEHGIPKSIELFTPDNGEYKNSTMNTEPEKISFNQSKEWELAAKSGDLRTFAIIEYTDMARQIAERASVDEVYSIVDDSAQPKDGMEELYKKVMQNLTYPAQARRMGIEGKVWVEFVVEKDGSISDLKAIKGIGGGCDEAAIVVLKTSLDKWTPGKNNGVPVKQKMVMPITFKLQGSTFKDEAKNPDNSVPEVVVSGHNN